MRGVFAYLLITVVVHGVVAAQMGAFEGFEKDVQDWRRARDQPAQVALERALRQPANIAAIKAALAADANPDGSRAEFPLFFWSPRHCAPTKNLPCEFMGRGGSLDRAEYSLNLRGATMPVDSSDKSDRVRYRLIGMGNTGWRPMKVNERDHGYYRCNSQPKLDARHRWSRILRGSFRTSA